MGASIDYIPTAAKALLREGAIGSCFQANIYYYHCYLLLLVLLLLFLWLLMQLNKDKGKVCCDACRHCRPSVFRMLLS